ncbi:MAG: hypothetical protein ACKVZ0_04380 [Gemmatimonadales bacterium]
MRTTLLTLGALAAIATAAGAQTRRTSEFAEIGPAPTSLAVTASAQGAVASWKPGAGSTGSILQRSADGITWISISKPIAEVSFVDRGVGPGSTVYYQVIAVYPTGNSQPTAAVAYTAPAPVSAVTPTYVNLFMGQGAPPGLDVYYTGTRAPSTRLYRQLLGYGYGFQEVPVAEWMLIGTSPAARTFDVGLQLNSVYVYKFLTKLADGTDVWSSELRLVTPRLDLAVTYVAQPARIHLQWNAFAFTGGYTIQKRSTHAPAWATIKTATGSDLVLTGTTVYEDTIVGPGQTFWYKVCALIERGAVCAESGQAGVAVL